MKFTLSVGFFVILSACSTLHREPRNENYSGIGQESISEQVIHKFSPQKIEPKTLSEIQKLLDLRSPGKMVVSENGDFGFFEWSLTGSNQVFRMDKAQGFPRQMTSGDESHTLLGFTPNQKWILFLKDRNGEENPGIYKMSVNGGVAIALFHQSKVQVTPGPVSLDSQWVYFSANLKKADQRGIYRVHVETGTVESILEEEGLWFVIDLQGEKLLLSKAKGSKANEVWEFNISTKVKLEIIGQKKSESYTVFFSNEANAYWVLTNEGSSFQKLNFLKGGILKSIVERKGVELEEVEMDSLRKFLFLEWNVQGRSELEVLDSKTLKPLLLPKFPEADHLLLSSATWNGKFFVLSESGYKTPRKQWLWDNQKQKKTLWVEGQLPEVDVSNWVAAELEHFGARDGSQVPYWLWHSKDCVKTTKPCPIVVDIHGGPASQSRPGFSPFYQMLMSRGFIVVAPNFRGSSGYGREYEEADDREKRLHVITDIEDLALHLRMTYAKGGEAPRLGVSGGSYGGYASLLAMTKFAGAYDVGAPSFLISNLISFIQNTAPYRRALRIDEYGDPTHLKNQMLELSPSEYLDQIKGPLFMIQGLNDPRTPAGEAIQIFDRIKAKGVPVELIVFSDEGHGTSKRSNTAIALASKLQFFETYLKFESKE